MPRGARTRDHEYVSLRRNYDATPPSLVVVTFHLNQVVEIENT